MVKKILKWKDKKFDEVLNDKREGIVPYAKAFGCGAIEGWIDATVVIGTVYAIIGAIDIIKGIKK